MKIRAIKNVDRTGMWRDKDGNLVDPKVTSIRPGDTFEFDPAEFEVVADNRTSVCECGHRHHIYTDGLTEDICTEVMECSCSKYRPKKVGQYE